MKRYNVFHLGPSYGTRVGVFTDCIGEAYLVMTALIKSGGTHYVWVRDNITQEHMYFKIHGVVKPRDQRKWYLPPE